MCVRVCLKQCGTHIGCVFIHRSCRTGAVLTASKVLVSPPARQPRHVPSRFLPPAANMMAPNWRARRRAQLLTCVAVLAACFYIWTGSVNAHHIWTAGPPQHLRPSSPSPPPLPPPPPPTARSHTSPPPQNAVLLPRLLSADRPAKASVRGNLAPASSVTTASTKDWLRDRWQAAADMNGTPVPGEHWVSVGMLKLSARCVAVHSPDRLEREASGLRRSAPAA